MVEEDSAKGLTEKRYFYAKNLTESCGAVSGVRRMACEPCVRG